MIFWNRVAGLAAALAATAGIAWVSNVTISPKPQGDAVLRLSWSARPERIETCRAQTEEEQAKLPAHMRQPVICKGESAIYRLEIRRDGNLVLEELLRGGGMRHDRPLYVFREIPQRAGDAAITIRLERLNQPPPEEASSQVVPGLHGVADLPRSVLFERRLHFVPGRAILVTYDPERREFVAVGN